MSVKQLRSDIRSWLEGIVRIDVWDLDVPANVPTVINGQRYPANSAVELPVIDLQVRRAGGYLEGSGRFVYVFLYRYPGKASKEQLPVRLVENLINYLAEQAIARTEDVSDIITNLDQVRISSPVTIARIEGEDNDWLVIGRLELAVDFVSNADADFGSLQPGSEPEEPFTPNEIRVGLNRSLSPVTPADPDTYTLDRLLQIDLEP